MTFVVQTLEGNKELSVPPNPFISAAPSKANTKIRPRRMALELEVIAEWECRDDELYCYNVLTFNSLEAENDIGALNKATYQVLKLL